MPSIRGSGSTRDRHHHPGSGARADRGEAAGEYVLRIQGLKTHFFTRDGVVKAVDGVEFSIKYGQTVGVVGESGCGKSITALSTMRLIERPGRTVAGEIHPRRA